jgi:hypothetical protein
MRLLAASEVFPLLKSIPIDVAGIRQDLLQDDACGPPLRVYLALSSGALGTDLSPEDHWLNRYYWFLRLAAAYRRKFGPDAGIEQQASQILETADWAKIDPHEFAQVQAAASADN